MGLRQIAKKSDPLHASVLVACSGPLAQTQTHWCHKGPSSCLLLRLRTSLPALFVLASLMRARGGSRGLALDLSAVDDADRALRLAVAAALALDGLDDVLALGHLAEDHVLPVQPAHE